VETFTFKIAKIYQGAYKLAVNFGGRCLQSVYEQFKSLQSPDAAVLISEGAAITITGKENIYMTTLKMVMDM
jgi:hypothetical protein